MIPENIFPIQSVRKNKNALNFRGFDICLLLYPDLVPALQGNPSVINPVLSAARTCFFRGA